MYSLVGDINFPGVEVIYISILKSIQLYRRVLFSMYRVIYIVKIKRKYTSNR